LARWTLPLKRRDLTDAPVFQGGPVQIERGFVLHESIGQRADDARRQPVYASSMVIPGGLEMTTSKDVLEAFAMGMDPRKVLVSLGYSAWGEGQLESELGENSWLTVDADREFIFDTPVEERYERALGTCWVAVVDDFHARWATHEPGIWRSLAATEA
jgi:putative transcriptional regulator